MRRKKKAVWKTPGWVCALAAVIGFATPIEAGVVRDADEYNLAAAVAGDQMHSDMALGPGGGYVVWDDNFGDSDGLSVNLRRITSTLNGQLNVISLATKTAGNQEHPRVALTAAGGAAFVWQGGADSDQRVYLRVMNRSDQFLSDEVAVSARADLDQRNPAVAGLANGNIVVVWSAFGADGDMQGVYGAVFGPTGQRLGAEFQVNQFTTFNQRNPVVTALPGSSFAVAWISEGQRNEASVDLYARLFNSNGSSATTEFRVNDSERLASSPSIAATASGNFTLAWCEIDQDVEVNGTVTPVNSPAGWDVYASSFTPTGGRLVLPKRVNQQVHANQRTPSLGTVGDSQMVVWTSFGQDGDRESVIGRSLTPTGAPEGDEFVVNTLAKGRQVQPVVRGNGDGRFVVAWSAFAGVADNYEIRAQRFIADPTAPVLATPPPPIVSPLSPTRVGVTWPAVDGYDVEYYELYMDGATTPTRVNGLFASVTLTPGTTHLPHSFAVAYRLKNGQVSPKSAEGVGKAFGTDDNFDGLPDDWQAQFYGTNEAVWARPGDDKDGDGMSTVEEFLAGTDPTRGDSVLRTRVEQAPGGWRLNWNTTSGQVYQVQQTSDFENWVPFGGQRFAPGTEDSVSVPVGSSLGYFRVIRIR